MDVPILTYDHELWVMTERKRSQIQVAKIYDKFIITKHLKQCELLV